MRTSAFLALIVALMNPPFGLAEGLCPTTAKTLFFCTAAKNGKIISLCEVNDLVQYRYGTKEATELILPEMPSQDNVFVAKPLAATSEEIGVGFTQGTHTYMVTNYFGGKPPSEFDHVTVTNGDKEIADIRCATDQPTEGSLSEIASNLEKKGFRVIPDPGSQTVVGQAEAVTNQASPTQDYPKQADSSLGDTPPQSAPQDVDTGPKKVFSEFGYKAIKFGMAPADIVDLGVCDLSTEKAKRWMTRDLYQPDSETLQADAKCYEIEGERKLFTFNFSASDNTLRSIEITLGLHGVERFDKLDAAVGEQYQEAYRMSQDDLAAYDKRQRSAVCNVYKDGGVALCIQRLGKADLIGLMYVREDRRSVFLKRLGINLNPIKAADF